MDPRELYRQAFEAAAQGCYSEASRLLERCLRLEPDHIPAHKPLAFVLRMMGKLKEALAHRLEVKRLDPSDLGNRYHLSNLYLMLGDKEEALQEADQILALEPHNKNFCALKDVILSKMREPRVADRLHPI